MTTRTTTQTPIHLVIEQTIAHSSQNQLNWAVYKFKKENEKIPNKTTCVCFIQQKTINIT